MIDTQAKPRPYVGLLALAALLGLITAVVTFVFIVLVHAATRLVWEQAASLAGLPPPVWTILICTVGGLRVGLLVRAFGDHSVIFAEIMREFGRSGRFDYRHAPGIVLTAIVSLASGASLGPEAGGRKRRWQTPAGGSGLCWPTVSISTPEPRGA